MAFGFFLSNTPEGKAKIAARDAISVCRERLAEQRPYSNEALFAKQTCEKMTQDYELKFGVSP